MKYKFIILLLISSSVYADSLFLGPSFYYTAGRYSNSNTSGSLAFYNLMKVNSNYTLLMHYNDLTINNTGWKFKQQGFAGGIIADHSPYVFKFNYGHYMGDYTEKGLGRESAFQYSDMTNVFNIDFFYYSDFSYLGGAYSYLNFSGLERLNNHQVTLRFDKFVSSKVFFSIKPTATILNDGAVLLSAGIRMNYYPSEHFIIKWGGFTGERTYYFDSDLIIMHNQDDIQRYQVFGQFEYVISDFIALIAAYDHTRFSSFEINYFVAGIRTGFWL